ncbi:MAG: hypothetical protein KAR42_02720 [candidate division Zixibacteria bacterium]|nr:hypothetical protein [candidate division Zixibacteria bacterium]
MLRKSILLLALIGLLAGGINAADPYAYVINTSGETLSKINLTTNMVTNNMLTLGSDILSSPNQIIIRDSLAYVLLSVTDEIQIINLKTESTVGWIDLPNGSNPFWMAFYNDQYLYVTLMVDDALVKVDVTIKMIVQTTPIGKSPEGILIYKDRAYVAITAYDFSTYTWGQGKVAVYDLSADTVLSSIEILTSTNPQFVDVDANGIIHCVCTGNYSSVRGTVFLIDPEIEAAFNIVSLGGDPSLLAIGADNKVFLSAGGWAADGEIFSYDAFTYEVYHDSANPIYVDSGAMGIVAFQDTTAFACTFGDRIIRINSNGDKINTYTMGDGPIHVAFDYVPGDANGDWEVNVGDAVYLVNFTFKGGAAPAFPRWRANANGDVSINVGDAVYLVNYAFKGGPAPIIGPLWVN